MAAKKKDLGHAEHSSLGKLTFATTWKVYGSFGHKDPAAAPDQLTGKPPARLTVGKHTVPGKSVRVKDGCLNLKDVLGKHHEGRTAYVLIPFTAPRTGEYSIGIGVDWWFEAWVDGKPLGNTLKEGNGRWPANKDDHSLSVTLDEGDHLLAIRAVSGSGSHTVAAGNHTFGGSEQEIQMRTNIGIASRIWRPIKIVFLGAGSGFLQALITDVMNIPGATHGELALVDIDAKRLAIADKLCRQLIRQMGTGWKVVASTDRRKVLKGADYIINCIEVSGVECVRHDNDIPLKYGIDQCIGDTIGPGGLFKALRTVPVFLDVLADVERYCPDAWVLNYTNPMTIMCLAAARARKAKVVGLCHSVQAASHTVAAWAGVPYHELKWQCAGVNHLAWITEATHNGIDVYPRIKERYRREKEFRENGDIVRKDLMMHFGYYCTESSGHDSEYLPYYRKNADVMKRYCRGGYEGGSRFYAANWPQWRKNCDQHRRDIVAGKIPLNLGRSWEYASYIIQAIETNDSCVIYGNMPNHGLITNLPQDGVVEVACLVNATGVHPIHYGKLPAQCAGLCDWNMRMFDLAADACINKSIETAAHALMLDPLTAAVSCPADIRKMTLELWQAEKKFLPGFKL